MEAAEELAGKIPFFEVNTGAIARGYRKNPYPSDFLLQELRRLGFGAVISSELDVLVVVVSAVILVCIISNNFKDKN